MAKKQRQKNFKLVIELNGTIPTLTGYLPVPEWSYLTECTSDRLVFMSNCHKSILRTAEMLMNKGNPSPVSAEILYIGPFAKGY